ncbi:DMT family transporter [Poseidonocella pacifica]|uniref:DMT family transporter n=1 Tax=Poseidonocella pacifica TaxID=871651 RepID=UPI001FE13B58|nr:DMT family transporter [Poseidonocella pacifica]
MTRTASSTALLGAGLVGLYTIVMSAADGVTKFFSGAFAAPQLFFFSGLFVSALCLLSSRLNRDGSQRLVTSHPWAMAARSALTVVAAVCFYYAFKTLAMAEVFIFIGMMPILAGLLARPILRERVGSRGWMALGAGALGIICLFPDGLAGMQVGHILALMACLSGTVSMILARYIGQQESRPLSLVFYPNLALCLSSGAVLPFVYLPMGMVDLGWAAVYAVLLFAGRYMVVHALKLMSAHAVMALVNMQFVWMVLIGAWVFGELPGANIYLGAAIVIASGLLLIVDQARRGQAPVPARRYAPAVARFGPQPRGAGAARAIRSKSSSHTRKNSWHWDYRSQIVRQSILR